MDGRERGGRNGRQACWEGGRKRGRRSEEGREVGYLFHTTVPMRSKSTSEVVQYVDRVLSSTCADLEAELLQERMTSQQLLKELRDLRDKASSPLPGMIRIPLPYS